MCHAFVGGFEVHLFLGLKAKFLICCQCVREPLLWLGTRRRFAWVCAVTKRKVWNGADCYQIITADELFQHIFANVDFSEHLCCKHVCVQVSALWAVNHTNILKAKTWSFSVVSTQAKQKIKMSSLESQLKGGRIGNFCPQIIKKLSGPTIFLRSRLFTFMYLCL